jgi:hypothetical protein
MFFAIPWLNKLIKKVVCIFSMQRPGNILHFEKNTFGSMLVIPSFQRSPYSQSETIFEKKVVGHFVDLVAKHTKLKMHF